MKYQCYQLAIALVLLGACSSTRTKFSDPAMRVFVSPDSVDAENYTRIVNALVETKKFTVIDRSEAFRAIKREQERLHRDESDRFDDKEKWAWWGRLLGTRTIIVPRVQCRTERSFWNRDRAQKECLQSLQAADANTGEIYLTVEGENSAPISYDMTFIVPDWEDTVGKFSDKYPTEWEKRYYTKEVQLYQDVSKEEAIRQKEQVLESKTPARSNYVSEPRPKTKPAIREVVEDVGRQVIDRALPRASVPLAPVLPIPAVSKPEVSAPRLPASTNSEAPRHAPQKREMAREQQQDAQLEQQDAKPTDTENAKAE